MCTINENHDVWFLRNGTFFLAAPKKSVGRETILQGRIQACFDSVQPLWAPKKTAQIFLQVQINNHIFH